MGVPVDVLDTQGLCDRVLEFTRGDEHRTVMYVNADCVLLALKDSSYREILTGADLVYADGVGVVWGARLWGHRLPGRSTAADFMPSLCQIFAEEGLRVFLLGASEGIARKASLKLMLAARGLQVVGTHHGYFPPEDDDTVIDQIRAAEPHILLVGFGAPKQEKWIARNASRLGVPVIWGVGGLFDFLSGRTSRGPQWLLDHGFEWLCRLAVEPGRLWRRYLIGNTRFVLLLLWHRFVVRGPS